MIGSGLKKLARENGMTVSNGVAYGSLKGYAATLSEGSGYKQIVFTLQFAGAGKSDELLEKVNQRNFGREFRVKNLSVAPNGVCVVFLDNPGTMKKIYAFLDWFLPLLGESSATGVNICTECGCEVTAGRWVLIDGVAFHLHDSCAEKVKRQTAEAETAQKEADTGSYFTGLLGSLGGAAIGAVVWAIVLNLGYVASVVGLLIGWLAEKGYTLLKGRQGKAKVLILILAIVFGVLLGTLTADVITLAGMISGGELPGYTYGDILPMIFLLLTEEAEYASATMSNILMGLLFAALGVFALLRKTGKAVADTKFVDLK